jgi:hypothetical protein
MLCALFAHCLTDVVFLVLIALRRKIRPYFLASTTSKTFYDVLGTAITTLTISYAAVTFVLLGGHECLAYLKNMYFAGHIELAVGTLILMFLPTPPSSSSRTFSKVE